MKQGEKMKKKDYRVYEGLRVASCLTFISGYLNAFTFVTQGGRFAGVQSGNLISLAFHVAQGNFSQAIHFFVPIIFFALGQCITYLAKRYALSHHLPWHFGSSIIMLILIVVTIIVTPFLPPFFTIAFLAIVASIQVETFRKLRGASYANVMMTGNVKNAAYLLCKGVIEKDKELRRTAYHIMVTIAAFLVGVFLSTLLSFALHDIALIGILLPLLYVNVQLWNEKRSRKNF